MPEALKESDELPLQYRGHTAIFTIVNSFGPDPDDDEDEEDEEDGANPDGEKSGGNPDARARKPAKPAKTRAEGGMPTAPIYNVAVSSEYPVDRWFGTEILDHSSDAVNLERASGMPVLLNHDSWNQIGVVERMSLDADKKLRADLRFSKNPEAAQVERDIADGIRRNISVGYRVNQYDVAEPAGSNPTYRATKWTPMEVSIVSVPADPTAGVGRSHDERRYPVLVRGLTPREGEKGATTMPQPTQTASAALAVDQTAEIVRLAQKFNMGDRVVEFIEQKLTLDQVRTIILDATATRSVTQPAAEPLTLTRREVQTYSYARAVLAAADHAEGKRTKSFEAEISEELEKRMPMEHQRRGGFYVPTSFRSSTFEAVRAAALPTDVVNTLMVALSGNRAIDSVTANKIKEVVFTVYGGELIEILRNQARVVQMGATVLTGLTSPVGFPRQTADVTAVWVAENPGSDVTTSDVGTDLVTLTPKTLMANTAYTRQLLIQSSVDVEAMVRASLAASHALAWDLAAIHGSGSGNQPTGIYSQSGVLAEDFSTATPANKLNWSSLVNMEARVAAANALLGQLGWLTTPGVAKAGKTTLKFAVNGSTEIWTGPILEGDMDGYVARATNQVKSTMGVGTNEHGLIFGNWNDLLIGQFGGAMDLIVDPYSLKKRGLIELTSFQMCDIAVRHPQSFCISSKLIP